MARGFGMTALRAALGGVAGYGQDVAARREREKVEAEMARQQERQAAMDRLAMRREGYMTPEEAGAAKKTGGAAVLRAALTGARDQVAIDQGLSAAAPQQAETFGGQQYTRETPFAKAAREADRALYQEREKEKREQAAKQGEFERNVQSAMSAYGMKRPQAEEYVRTGKSPFLPMSQQERDASARGWADISLRRKEQPKTPTPPDEIDKRLSVGARNSIADYNAAIYALEEARKLVQKSPGAFGLVPTVLAKGGAVGRTVRESVEKGRSAEYQRARAQLQSSLMKLRKTQFGTQMTRLEKETGEEAFPSGAESSGRLLEMLDVQVNNAEGLRRGVYEANNAADLYRPVMVTPQNTAPPRQDARAGSAGKRGSALDELEDEGI